jgi:hypothetical protein
MGVELHLNTLMKDIYEEMMANARVIATSFLNPGFMTTAEALNLSRSLLIRSQIVRCRSLVLNQLKDDSATNAHSERVALELGPGIEGKGFPGGIFETQAASGPDVGLCMTYGVVKRPRQGQPWQLQTC